MKRLFTIAEAANEMGVKPGSFRREAERHGLLVRVGREIRFDPATFPEFIEKCRDREKAPASGSAKTMAAGSSLTAQSHVPQARKTAAKLKRRSPATLPKKTGPSAQIHPIE